MIFKPVRENKFKAYQSKMLNKQNKYKVQESLQQSKAQFIQANQYLISSDERYYLFETTQSHSYNYFYIMMLQKQRMLVELHITTWMSEVAELYDFNSRQQEERSLFKSIVFSIEIPKHETSTHYYFLHQNIYKEAKHEFLLERRMSSESYFNFPSKNVNNYRLLGGFKLFKQVVKDTDKVFVQLIAAEDIKIKSTNGVAESVEKKKPFYIVRSFKHGFPLKKDQIIKLGKTLFQITMIEDGNEKQGGDSHKQIFDIDAKDGLRSSQTGSESEEKLCRVCYDTDGFDEQKLICTCKCRGSTAFLHIKCLKRWLIEKLSKLRSNSRTEGKVFHIDQLQCEICRTPYPKAIRVGGKRYDLLPFIENQQAYIGLNITHPENGSEASRQQEAYVSIMEHQVVNIGRLDTNNLVIFDNAVSRNHGEIKMIKNKASVEFRIFDHKSKFGTLIYEKDAIVRLHRNSLVGVEIGTSVLSLKLITK